MEDVVRPLQHKEETVSVVAGSDAEHYVPKKFPHKHMKRVGNGIRPQSIEGFVIGMPLAFQRGRSEGLDATYHFTRALLLRRIRLRGSPRLLRAFARCFPT